MKKPLNKQVEEDKKLFRLKSEGQITSKKYKTLLREYEELETKLAAAVHLGSTPQEFLIAPHKKSASEATAFIIASDWHIEERVKPGDVNGLNEYSLAIADERVSRFWYNAVRLVKMFQKEKEIKEIVLALLGDFISGSIHEELLEINQLRPAEAIFKAQNYLISGIKYILANTDCRLTIVCHPGNHSRLTKFVHFSTEMGNSLEGYMYHNLAYLFKGEKRVRFIIAEGYLTYLNVYGYVLRFHHGTAIRYQGGRAGIFAPTFAAIENWDKGRRADLTVFGHWHQFKDGGSFIINGSLIGYNAFAVSIKAAYERPQQAFFLVDKTMGKSIVAPIWVTK